MREKMMLLLLLFIAAPIASEADEETGSRSKSIARDTFASAASLDGASYVGRDFRSIVLHWKTNVSGNNSTSDKSIGKRIAFFKPDTSTWKEKQRKKLRMKKQREVTQNNQVSGVGTNRSKRSEDVWIDGEIEKSDKFLRMHAFIVKDEDIPECGITANKITQTRYFMCSGIILNENHVLTTVSCIRYADIFEYHIDAKLAVLIGALDEDSYVIRVSRVQVHPRYVPNLDTMYHAKHDIALLQLSCSISRDSMVMPQLPSNPYDDIGHLCYPDRCRVLTIIENSKNRHRIREIKIKHILPPTHDSNNKTVNSVDIFKTRFRGVMEKDRKRKIPQNKMHTSNNLAKRKGREITDKIESETNNNNGKSDADNDETPLTMTDTIGNTSGSKSAESGLTKVRNGSAIDWRKIKTEISDSNVSQENKIILSNFVKNSMSDIMTRILETMTQRVADIDDTFPYFVDILEETKHFASEDLNERISDMLGKTLIKFASTELGILPQRIQKVILKNGLPTNYTDETLRRMDDGEPKENRAEDNAGSGKDYNSSFAVVDADEDKSNSSLRQADAQNSTKNNLEEDFNLESHVYCPPLGSPVISNDKLVALIAYTCDDAQEWVEWKYIDVVNNVKWIRREITKNFTSSKDGDFNLQNC